MPEQRPSRNPRQDYLLMGLSIGEQVIFDGLETEVITITGPHKLMWCGREYYLTQLRKVLGPKVGLQTFPADKILTIDERRLDDLYYAIHSKPSSRTR